jgi:16S rRNA (guanine966-N2)-methyltransferase
MLKKPKSRSLGQIRIIGGQWRGRKLPVPDSAGLRPTTDRVRETLFNWLAGELVNARCLDCFAGSGILGLEALSRYADKAVLIEFDRQVARQLEKNLAVLNAAGAEVIHADTLVWLDKAGSPFDVVFVDPPFRKGMLQQTLHLLEQNGWLADSASIYVEAEQENQNFSVPQNWHLYREKSAGQVCYRLYHRSCVSEGEMYVD